MAKLPASHKANRNRRAQRRLRFTPTQVVLEHQRRHRDIQLEKDDQRACFRCHILPQGTKLPTCDLLVPFEQNALKFPTKFNGFNFCLKSKAFDKPQML